MERFINTRQYKHFHMHDSTIPISWQWKTFKTICDVLFTESLYNELKELNELDLQKYKSENKEIFTNFMFIWSDYLNTYDHYTDYQLEIIRILFDIIKVKRNCSLDEFMVHNDKFDPSIICKNTDMVKGNCSGPYFLESLSGWSVDENNKIVQLLSTIQTILEEGKSIGIILGAVYDREFEELYDINLFFDNKPRYEDFDFILDEIVKKPLRKSYYIRSYFPLNTEPDNLRVLDLILNLTNKYQIFLVNRMCIGCYRSFFYLKKNAKKNFTYISGFHIQERVVSPKENIHQINNCFLSPYNNTQSEKY